MGRAVAAVGLVALFLGCLLAAPVEAQDAPADPTEPPRGLAFLLAGLQATARVSSALELLQALNATAGSSVGELIVLTEDIFIQPQDLHAFEPWLPLNGGNRTVLLLGARPANASGGSAAAYASTNSTLGPPVVLDFGGAVDLMYHPVNHEFITYNVFLQGMAPASSGYAAGLTTQMVGGTFWPSTTGEPHHRMSFYNSTIRLVTATCGANSTEFSVAALHQVLGRNDTVTQLDPQTFFVGQRINGSYAIRILPTGDAAGNVRWSWDNTTITCVRPQQLGATRGLELPQTAPTGIAGSAEDLLHLLDNPNITTILLAGHLSLQGFNLSAFRLPIVLQGRRVDIKSSDELPKVLDLGGNPQLLYLSSTASLSFERVRVQGAAPPSQVMTDPARTTLIVSPSLWPTVDGEAGHQLIFGNASLQIIATPCSRNSTQIQVDLLRKMLGEDAVQRTSDRAYIEPRFQQPTPIRSILTREQLGSTSYTFERTEISCVEDSGVGLAAELQAQLAVPASSSSASGGNGFPSWVAAVIAVPAALCLAAAATAGFLLLRRRRAATRLAVAQPKAVAAADEQQPLTPRSGKMDRMESGELKSSLQLDAVAGADVVTVSPAGTALTAGTPLASPVLSRASSAGGGSATRLSDGALVPAGGGTSVAPHQTTASKLWRARFTGVIEGLEIGELLGRGAYGRVYKSRWNGAIVATKVVEHSVAKGGTEAMSREPLLCMSVSHPNCVQTYKLSAIRLLRGEGLVGPDDSATSVPLLPASPAGPSPAGSVNGSASAAHKASEQGAPSRPPSSEDGISAFSATLGDSAQLTGTSQALTLSDSLSNTAITAAGDAAAAPACVRQPRRVHSLLSGAEGVEVADPYGPLAPGLYETWMVLEYCDRGSLADALAERRLVGKDGRPHMVAVLLCLLDVASGMSYLHSLGIVHGDLKPANVLLKGVRNSVRGFHCKLGDFGLSRMLDGRSTHVQTGSLGTPTHAAPELLREGRLGPAVDVYAFGVLAWELVAGEEAWRGLHPMQIILQVTQQGVRPPPLPDCPPRLAALMAACWAEDPQRRPTFADMVPQLQEMVQAARQAGPIQPLASRPASARSSAEAARPGDCDSAVSPDAGVPAGTGVGRDAGVPAGTGVGRDASAGALPSAGTAIASRDGGAGAAAGGS